jgi:hypothetical protein
MATGNIPGTNIPKSAVANNVKGDWKYWEARIKGAENPNDVLFELAYNTHFEGSEKKGADYQGQGPGNPNVGNIQAGRWKLVGDTDTKDHKAGTSWAEEHINSSNDVYIQDDGNVISMDPDTGKVLVNQKDSDGNLGKPPVGAVITGDQSKLDTGLLDWINTNTVDKSSSSVSTGVKTAADQISLLGYRPWTQRYADKYLSDDAQSLLTMDKTSLQPEYSLSYLPGEFRDPNTWQAGAGGGGEGHIPGGAWRRAVMEPDAYTKAGHPRQNIWAKSTKASETGRPAGVTDYKYLNAPAWNVRATDPSLVSATNPQGVRQASTPWDFTSPAHSQGNVAWQDWTPKGMNLNADQVKGWQGLLKTMDTSPTITPGLLTTGKGGPISFDGKGAKKTGKIVIDN